VISPLVPGAFVAAALLIVVHRNTRFGQHLRFAGEHPEALTSQGVSVRRVRWLGVLLAGVLCGLAGAYLSVAHGSGFARNMTAGRGYIALAALIIGCWTPLGALLAALAFGAIDATQILLQGATFANGQAVPVQWIQMLPYIATLVILAGAAGGRLIRARPPKALGTPLA
jgi:simple sugar transport system permease protein